MDQVAKDADSLLGGDPDTGLIQDETSFPKAGKKSVAVNRQWCGTLGKVDNCQVGVFSSLVLGSSAALVDCRHRRGIQANGSSTSSTSGKCRFRICKTKQEVTSLANVTK